MGYKVRLLGADNFPNGFFKGDEYQGPRAQLYKSFCKYFNASNQLDIVQYNDSVFKVHKKLIPLGENELFVGSVLHLLPYNGSITTINARIATGLSLIIPRRETSYSTTSYFNSGVKLILLFLLLASLIWFLMPRFIECILRYCNRGNGFENIENSKKRSISTIFYSCYAMLV